MLASYYEGNHTFSVKNKDRIPPRAEEVQIKVAFCGVCGTDMHIYHGDMDRRVRIPLTIGHEMSGVISALGADVKGFEVGDKVVVRPLDNRAEKKSDKGFSHICEGLKFIGIDSEGAMQQFWNVPAFTLHKLDEETDLQLAALVEPLAVACHDVRLADLSAGEYAVVLGGGPIGMLVALAAKEKGAEVLISEVNSTRIAFAKKLGFNVVDPSKQDVVEYVQKATDGRLADVVFEVAGVQETVDLMTEVAGIRGRIVMVAIHGESKKVNLFMMFWKELRMIGARVYEEEDYEKAISLISNENIPFASMITKISPLSDIQRVFESIDKNPEGMKVLFDCQK